MMDADVLVFGGGVAGLTAAVLAARSGLEVVCVEPKRFPRRPVGESLDWSAPRLLADLGLPRDDLVSAGIGTYKREVRAFTAGGERLVGRPPGGLDRWPLRFGRVTVHLDRERFDQALYEQALDSGVRFVWDRVRTVDVVDDRVRGCVTSGGDVYRARWCVDASGRARVVGRAAGIGTERWGCDRIAIWTQQETAMQFEGTLLHLDDRSDGLVWAWEIPITRRRCSVGVVMPLTQFSELRNGGQSLDDTLSQVLARFPTLEPAMPTIPVRARKYRPHVSERVAGVNWLMAGEAAAFVDPLSSVGVSTAMRHATEAAQIITTHHGEPFEAARRDLAGYDHRVRQIARLYNRAVEGLLYQPTLRHRLGIRQASRAYVILGYLTNSIYTRLAPTEPPNPIALAPIVGFFNTWVRSWRTLARVTPPRHPAAPRP